MEAAAKAVGRKVTVQLHTASDLLADLALPVCVGLSHFWFGTIEITPAKLAGWLRSATLALGERFHPEDHVEVAAQEVPRSLSRSPSFRQRILKATENCLELYRLDVPAQWRNDAAKVKFVASINRGIDDLARIQSEATQDPALPWPIASWRAAGEALANASRKIAADARSEPTSDDNERNHFHYFGRDAHKVASAAEGLVSLLASTAGQAELTRAALCIGPAGCGKSHLLAAAAQEILNDDGLCVLLLGHRFNIGNLWAQIATHLDAAGKSKRELLGALDTASAAARRRGVIVIDALNEGGLRTSWFNDLAAFIDDVLQFKNLAVIVSCRDVFVPNVISPGAQSRCVIVTVQGFETEEEQESAARVFLDKRGVSRPCAPWLAPEFVNPLFLRSCSEAMKVQGLTTFPTGLLGAKQVLSFYVDAIAANLKAEIQIPTNLATPCKRALVSIARAMARGQRDWVGREEAAKLITEAFKTYATPPASDWMTALLTNGVLREDPHPDTKELQDPLATKPDVVRFAFQRFQDHLMAEALLGDVTDAQGAFATGGALAFAVHPDGHPRWEWNGLMEALSIQVPEKFSQELVDVLPGGAQEHWGDYTIERTFVQSIKWRDPASVSERSRELVNRLSNGVTELLSLFIELAPRRDHPWNAERLSRSLKRWKLPVRDQHWTMHISEEGAEPHHPIARLITWSAAAPKELADREVLRLSAIALTWFCTSSSRWIRDNATKALSSLFTDRPDLFPDIASHFADIDDVYVLERLLASAFGSLVRFPDAAKAKAFADTVWQTVFARGSPCPDLLLRERM
jgi:hypothetical protein